MIFWFFFSLLIALLYVYLVYQIYSIWQKIPEWEIPAGFKSNAKATVVIAARNESLNISTLLDSIFNQNSVQTEYEVIVVNDHSTDKTKAVLESYDHEHLTVLDLPDGMQGKKAALAFAISQSKGDWILVTDADCEVPARWVDYMISFLELNDKTFAAAPVNFNHGSNILERLQVLDLTGMMAVTLVGINSTKWYMANGANMAFSKQAFISMDGFRENEKFASGDDMFLVQQMALNNSDRVGFVKIKDAVMTASETSWSAFFQQRLRWATKNRSYGHTGVTKTLGFVFLFNILILINLLLIPIWGGISLFIFLIMLALKLVIDYLYLNNLTNFFHQKEPMKQYILVAMANVFYIVSVGMISLFRRKYTWKGRKVS